MSTKSLKVLLLLSCAALVFLLNNAISERQEKLVFLQKQRDNIYSLLHVLEQQKDMPFANYTKAALVVAYCFEKIEKIASTYQVKMEEKKMGEVEGGKDIFLSTQHLNFRLTSSSLVDIHKFLYDLQNQEYFYHVDKVDIINTKPEKEDSGVLYTVEMHLTVYFVNEDK